MKITPIGKAALFLIFLTLWNAVNGGLNTLYMVYSAVASALMVAWAALEISAFAVEAQAEIPEQTFAGDQVPIKLTIRNRGLLPAIGLAAVTRRGRTPLGDLSGRSSTEVVVPYRFTRRGRTNITDLGIEFSFPFRLFIKVKAIPVRGIVVFPSLMEFSGKPRMQDVATEEVARPRRGAGDDFWSVREYRPGDDVRLVSWKLSAKQGRPMIREFAEMAGDRITVRAEGRPFGEAAERRISEAASIARFFIDEGAEVRLVTDEGKTGFGRGLLHLATIFERLALLGEGAAPRKTGLPMKASDMLPSTDDRPHLAWAAWAMAAVAAACLWIAEGLDPATKILVSAAVPAGFLMDRFKRHPVPASLLNVMNVVVIAAVLFVDIPLAGLLPGLTHLLSWALVNRLISRKRERDGGTIALICFLLFMIVSWQTIDPAYFAAFVAFFAATGVWASLTSEAVQKIDRRRGAALAVCILLVLAIAGAVFAATPRVSNPRFAKMMRQLGLANMVVPELSIVKLADRVTLGIFDDVRVNSRRVMQVKVTGIDIPKGAALYVRGGALDRFDGKSWTRSRYDFPYLYFGRPTMSKEGRASYEKRGEVYTASASGVGKSLVVAEFFVYPMATSVIFSVGDPTAVQGDVLLPSFDLTGTAYSYSNFEKGGRYVVSSGSFDIRIDDLVEGYDDVLSTLYLGLPLGPDAELVRELAAEVAGAAVGPEAKALAIERYFREGFVYSYLGKHGRQSLREFLTDTKAANCEYHATAMALMLRALGVPARLAIGYVSTDWKQVGEYFDVRNSDGHAWVEAFVPGRGWVSYDPTPDVVGYIDFGFPLGRDIYMYYLGLQMSWYRYVIGYDFYLQQDAFASVISMWRDIVASLALAAIVVIVGAAALFVARTYLTLGRPRCLPCAAASAYAGAEKLLARYGFRRRPWETPQEFARGITRSEPELFAAERMVQAYYRWRYGGEGKDELHKALADLKSALRHYGEMTTKIGR